MPLFARSGKKSSQEYVPPPQTIARRWSAPATPTTWEDIRPCCSDATFKDHSVCSDTAVDEKNKAYEELRILTKDGPEPIQDHPHCFMKCSHNACEVFLLSHMNADIIREHECHECIDLAPRRTIGNANETFAPASAPPPPPVDDFRLQLYALEIRSMTQKAIDDLVTSGGTEPFPAYNDFGFIGGIDPYGSEPETAVPALRLGMGAYPQPFRPRSNRPVPSDDGGSLPYFFPRSWSIDDPSIAGNISIAGDLSSSNASPFNSGNSTRPSTRPSSIDVGAPVKPGADSLDERRVKRTGGCYFSTSWN